MISCFSDSDDTDVCHCCMISNRSSPSHFTKDSPSLIFPKSEPGQLQTIYATAWKTTKDIIWEITASIYIQEVVSRRNAHAAVHLRMINQFQESQYTILLTEKIAVWKQTLGSPNKYSQVLPREYACTWMGTRLWLRFYRLAEVNPSSNFVSILFTYTLSFAFTRAKRCRRLLL